MRAKFAHLIDYTSEITCRDCGTKRPALYFFGVRDDKTGICAACMRTQERCLDCREYHQPHRHKGV